MTSPSFSNDDLTQCIRRVEEGDDEAAAQLWEHCFPKLLRYSRAKLPPHMRRILDEEDVALSAFKSFCVGAEKGTLGDINGRDELWRLLFCIAGRKANMYLRYQTRQKRGGGQVAGESVFLNGAVASSFSEENRGGIDQVPDDGQSPQAVAQFTQDCQTMMDQLDDENLQTIALLRIEGYSVDEISQRIGCAKRSVERRLNLIRQIWKSVINEDDSPPPSK